MRILRPWRRVDYLAVLTLALIVAYLVYSNHHVAHLNQPVALIADGPLDLAVTVGTERFVDNLVDLYWPDYEPAQSSPLEVYVGSDHRVYVDAAVYTGANTAALQIEGNALLDPPRGLPGWDWNANRQGLEIVDGQRRPVFQMLFIPPDAIRIRGVFAAGKRIAIADCSGPAIYAAPRPLTMPTLGCPRLFKYPAWRYPGQFR